MPSRPNDFDLWAEGLARVLVSPARAKALLQCQKRLDLTQQYTVTAVELSVTFMIFHGTFASSKRNKLDKLGKCFKPHPIDSQLIKWPVEIGRYLSESQQVFVRGQL